MIIADLNLWYEFNCRSRALSDFNDIDKYFF